MNAGSITPHDAATDINDLMRIHRTGIIPDRVSGAGSAGRSTGAASAQSFAGVLQSKTANVRFSAHASTRLRSRNIEMTSEIMGKLEKAVDGAAGKGAKDSLVLMKNLAFIVNIPNRTVVTAMDGESLKENIFTNIDSTVIAEM